MPCNIDCLSTYSCGDPIEVTPGAIYAPYVKLTMQGGAVITVGNNSAPGNNMAAITSMTYGITPGTPGYGIDLEIVDNGGTMYRQIIKQINKTIKLVGGETFNASVDFGWVITDCNGSTRLETATGLTGLTLYGIFTEVEQTYENALIKLILKSRGPQTRAQEVRHDGAIFDEDNKGSLKDALTKLFTEYDPKFANVLFIDKDGNPANDGFFKNSDGGPAGPKGSWPMSQQNPFAIARTWLQSVVTKNDLGILINYDPNTASVVFQEDPTQGSCCRGSYGTYVINGGNCSPVLSFNPTISWPKGMIPGGGGVAGGSSTGINNIPVEPTIDIERAGTQTSVVPQQHEWLWRNPDDQPSKTALGIAAHMEANSRVEGSAKGGMTAELKIIGDPEYINPVSLVGRWLSLVVINPFHITNRGQDCVWLTTSNCHATLSNKKWLIRGVSHQIQNGSYVTTFNLMLPQPNVDIDANDTLGGAGCGTESFDNSQTGDADSE